MASGACDAHFKRISQQRAAQVWGRMELHSGAPPGRAALFVATQLAPYVSAAQNTASTSGPSTRLVRPAWNTISPVSGSNTFLPTSQNTRGPRPATFPWKSKPTTECLKSSVPSMRLKKSWNTPRLTTVLPVTEFVRVSVMRPRLMNLTTSPPWSKKTVPVKVPVVSRMMSTPSHWSKTSVPDSENWNLSGGVAEAAVTESTADTAQTPNVMRSLRILPPSIRDRKRSYGRRRGGEMGQPTVFAPC